MIDVNIDGMAQALKALDSQQKQIPFATALALTRTAKAVEQDVRAEMPKVFDNPTPFTIKGTYARPAKKSKLFAEVGLKDWSPKGGNARDYLQPSIYGGKRKPKRSEKSLRSRGHLSSGEFMTPGRGAKLNNYGNVAKGQVVKAMSNVRGQFDSQQDSKQPGKYFWLPGRGIFFRRGKQVKAFLVIARNIRYKKRFDFHSFAARRAQAHLPSEAQKAVQHAIDTAR